VLTTDYGYHIILRLPLEVDTYLGQYFSVMMEDALLSADIKYSKAYDSVAAAHYCGVFVFYTAEPVKRIRVCRRIQYIPRRDGQYGADYSQGRYSHFKKTGYFHNQSK